MGKNDKELAVDLAIAYFDLFKVHKPSGTINKDTLANCVEFFYEKVISIEKEKTK